MPGSGNDKDFLSIVDWTRQTGLTGAEEAAWSPKIKAETLGTYTTLLVWEVR